MKTQEVQVILTLEVDITISKEEITKHFNDMKDDYVKNVSKGNNEEFPQIISIQVKEEAEIYNNQ